MVSIKEFWIFLKSYVFINSNDILEQVGVILAIIRRNNIENYNYYEMMKIFNEEVQRINERIRSYNSKFEDEYINEYSLEIYYNIPNPQVLEEILEMIKSILIKYTPQEIFLELLKYYNFEKEKNENKIQVDLYAQKIMIRNKFILECFPKTGGRTFLLKNSLWEGENVEFFVYERFEKNILILKKSFEDIYQKIYLKDLENIFKEYEYIIFNDDFFYNKDLKQYLFYKFYDRNLSLNGKIIITTYIEKIDEIIKYGFLEKIKGIFYDVNKKIIQIIYSQKNNMKIEYKKKIEGKYINIKHVDNLYGIIEDITNGKENLDYYINEYDGILDHIKKLKRMEKKENYRIKLELEKIKNEIIIELKKSMY